MRTAVLNREFKHPADGWYPIETPGEHPNEKSGVVQVIDRQAVASMVNRFNQEATDYTREHGRPFPGTLIDHEHFKHDSTKETTAYGWLMQLEDRGGVPFGRISWTATGQPAVDGGDYRFFSTEYDPKDLVNLNPGQTPARVRPMRLDGLTLTNDPNNQGGAPITNRKVATNPYGSHGTAEAHEAARQANQKLLADNQAAAKAEADARMAAEANRVGEFHLPALERWFEAVKNIMDIAEQKGGVSLGFDVAWTMARQQHPDWYDAAFGKVNADALDEKSAGAKVGMLANRIQAVSKGDFQSAWNLVREKLPRIFNRMDPAPARILNRQRETAPQFVTKKAAKLFGELARGESALQKIPLSQAWQRVQNRRPALAELAAGKLTLAQACVREPELRELLT